MNPLREERVFYWRVGLCRLCRHGSAGENHFTTEGTEITEEFYLTFVHSVLSVLSVVIFSAQRRRQEICSRVFIFSASSRTDLTFSATSGEIDAWRSASSELSRIPVSSLRS